jgi:hypothetical protein
VSPSTSADTSPARPSCASVALSLGGLRRRIEVALLPDDVRVVLQLDGLAERERHRRWAQALLAVAVLALALLHDPASAQARSGGAMQFVNQGGCPSGYYTSGSFCGPLNKDSRPAGRSRRGRAAPPAGISPVRPA